MPLLPSWCFVVPPQPLQNLSCCCLQQTLSVMKAHAHDLLESILANPNITDSDLMGLPEEHKSDLRKRVQAADLVSEGCLVKQCCRLLCCQLQLQYGHANTSSWP